MSLIETLSLRQSNNQLINKEINKYSVIPNVKIKDGIATIYGNRTSTNILVTKANEWNH